MAQLPAVTLGHGGRVAILTQGRTPFDSRAAVKLSGDVVDELDRGARGTRTRVTQLITSEVLPIVMGRAWAFSRSTVIR